ncbi:MAG: phage gp6-like head-tail connector protein, partial [Clostridia bacterium]|nr:phage gp6-like head-tail connector protein [Clostridia bacterium]
VSFEPEPDEEGNVPEVPQPDRLAVILMTSFYYENRDIPDMTTYKATRMAFDSLLYPYRDPEKMF